MLLLPTTLTALSVALGSALLPVPSPEDAMLPAAELVAGVAYEPDIRTGDASEHDDPGMPYLSDVVAAEDDSGPAVAAGPPPPEAFDQQEGEDDSSFGLAADQERLDGMRGGDGSTSGTIVMNGTVADNRATNVITGTNMITEGSFANASGVPMVVQNTGANVLIQNATVINLQLH